MTWQEERSFYEERDEPDESPEVELTEATCFECRDLFATPADDGERFCSRVCEDRWCTRARAEATGPTTDDDADPQIPF